MSAMVLCYMTRSRTDIPCPVGSCFWKMTEEIVLKKLEDVSIGEAVANTHSPICRSALDSNSGNIRLGSSEVKTGGCQFCPCIFSKTNPKQGNPVGCNHAVNSLPKTPELQRKYCAYRL